MVRRDTKTDSGLGEIQRQTVGEVRDGKDGHGVETGKTERKERHTQRQRETDRQTDREERQIG